MNDISLNHLYLGDIDVEVYIRDVSNNLTDLSKNVLDLVERTESLETSRSDSLVPFNKRFLKGVLINGNSGSQTTSFSNGHTDMLSNFTTLIRSGLSETAIFRVDKIELKRDTEITGTLQINGEDIGQRVHINKIDIIDISGRIFENDERLVERVEINEANVLDASGRIFINASEIVDLLGADVSLNLRCDRLNTIVNGIKDDDLPVIIASISTVGGVAAGASVASGLALTQISGLTAVVAGHTGAISSLNFNKQDNIDANTKLMTGDLNVGDDYLLGTSANLTVNGRSRFLIRLFVRTM